MYTHADLKKMITESPFRRNCYSVDIAISNLFPILLMYTHGRFDSDAAKRGTLIPSDVYEAVPAFQRDNDKWSMSMQVKFIENVILGFKTTLMFYQMIDDNLTDCKILDGLQRITALQLFVDNKLPVFGGFYYRDLIGDIIHNSRGGSISLRIYNFASDAEAAEFYISMNEGITHSKEDIVRAKQFLKNMSMEA